MKVKMIFILFLLFASQLAIASVPSWQIVPHKSSLSFIATQNNAPVKGQFKNFTGEINFDPDKLSESHVRIVVDLNSVTTSYGQVADTLKTTDWFNVKVFPKAIFTSNSFTKTGNNSYEANGMLQVRDKTLPLQLTFNIEKYTNTEAIVSGKTNLKRTAFGVGQGEWANTNQVKDDVEVDFALTATK